MKEIRSWTRTSRGFIISLGDTVWFHTEPQYGVVTYIDGAYISVTCEDAEGELYEREFLENELFEVSRRNTLLMFQLLIKHMLRLRTWKIRL